MTMAESNFRFRCYRTPEWFAEQYSYYRLQADKPKPAALAAYLTS